MLFAGACTDTSPSSWYTCAQQAGWGQCSQSFMQVGARRPEIVRVPAVAPSIGLINLKFDIHICPRQQNPSLSCRASACDPAAAAPHQLPHVHPQKHPRPLQVRRFHVVQACSHTS